MSVKEEFISTKEVFNPKVFYKGVVLYVKGYDEDGEKVEGNFIVVNNHGDDLIVTGVHTNRMISLESVKSGEIKIHVYEPPTLVRSDSHVYGLQVYTTLLQSGIRHTLGK